MDLNDFQGNFPGRLVPSAGVMAYDPHPVPRDLPFGTRTIHLIAEAENAVGQLRGASAQLVDPLLIASPLLRREALLSSRIEGTITTPEELVLFEAAQAEPAAGSRHPEETKEVLNYVRAVQQGLSRLKVLPVSLRLITELHSTLMSGVRGGQERPGEFRRSQNFIGRPGASIHEARFVPPPVSDMHRALDDLEKFMHEQSDLPLLVRLALIHYQFETIHPFRDGNGRIGRLLIPLLLCSTGRLEKPLLFVSAYFERNRTTYYDQLFAVSSRGAWPAWIDFFLEAVRASAVEALGNALALVELREKFHQRVARPRASALLRPLIDELFKRPAITIGQAARLLRVTPATASARIAELCETGILEERTGGKRDQVFVAMALLRFIDALHGERPSTTLDRGRRARLASRKRAL